tara:strand:- start:298 stop:519 length:222 start_codon:yes stop_codon:yes gene_type:complete
VHGTCTAGYDDERGDYAVVPRDHICYRYEVVGIIGKGSFGQVVHTYAYIYIHMHMHIHAYLLRAGGPCHPVIL